MRLKPINMEALKDLNSIEKLLATTGWSCDELFNKLQEYKAKETPKDIDIGQVSSTSIKEGSETIIKTETEITELIQNENNVSNVIPKNTSSSSASDNELVSPQNEDSDEKSVTTETLVTIGGSSSESCEDEMAVEENNKESESGRDPEPSTSSQNFTQDSMPPLPKINLDVVESVQKRDDNIRNFLKQQLSFLRTKKNTKNCFAELPKKSTEVYHKLKENRKRQADFTTGCDEEEEEEETIKPANKKRKDNLISLTDETQFMILDVTGGVDRVDDLSEKSAENCKISNSSQSAISCEIRDIKKKRTSRLSYDDHSNSSTSNLISAVDKSPKAPTTSNFDEKRPFNVFHPHEDEYATVTPIIPKVEIEENPPMSTCSHDETVNKIAVKSFAAVTEDDTSPIVSSIQATRRVKQSPFVSDSLDDFLTTKSQLNISYSIPKLGAEEGIKEGPKESPYDKLTTPVTNYRRVSRRKGRSKLIKAKTVAEMRKELEKMKRQEQESNVTIKNDELVTDEDEKKELQLPSEAFTLPETERNGCIIYNKQVLRVTLTKTARSLLQIKDDFVKPLKKSPIARTSLLATLTESTQPINKVEYKPGPLSKKPYLQSKSSSEFWTTHVKKLPQIYFEVQPQFGKPIDPRFVHMVPIFEDPVMSQERVDFALTAVKNIIKDENEDSLKAVKTFKFPLRYDKDRDQFVVTTCRRKKTLSPVLADTVSTIKIDLDTDDVRDVIDDLLKYVKIKEISDSLIKDDDPPESPEPEPKEVDPNETAKKELKKKKPSFYAELMRLNCKFIDVANHEDGVENCRKLHCRLGCVCKSLNCDQIYSNHCQLVECMFECTCPPSSNQVLTSKNTVSDLNVTHLDDHAKRNLAKVERDFIQTIIKTDDDTILVGSSRTKSRRATKAPKKYTDYVEVAPQVTDIRSNLESYSSDSDLNNCRVNLIRYDLSDVVPLCLGHSLYNCAICITSKVTTRTKPSLKHAKQRKASKIHLLHQSELDSCARSRPIFSQYSLRNRNPVYQAKLWRKYSIYKITPSDSDPMIVDVDERRPSKRKQTLNVRQFTDIVCDAKEFAIQRRKLKSKPVVVNPKFVLPKPVVVPDKPSTSVAILKLRSPANSYVPIFPGEMKLPLNDNPEAEMIVGKNNISEDFVRIVPWDCLIRGFREGSINIWAMMDRPSVLLCNVRHKDAPKNFIDIRLIEAPSQITTWIIRNILPADKPKDSSYVVLKPTKNHFVIAGFCVKNKSTTVGDKGDAAFKGADMLRIDEPKLDNNMQGMMAPKTTLKCVHKDIRNCLKILILNSKLFDLRTLYGEKEQFKLALPRIPQSCRWRMIHLTPTFEFLRFSLSDYSIKHTDLMDAVQTSQNYARTIALRNVEFTCSYKHPIFGLFVVPQCQDRIFVGPFLAEEEHNIETLRSNGVSLVDISVYSENDVVLTVKNSFWITEAGSNTSTPPQFDAYIDITQDDDDDDENTNAQDNNEFNDDEVDEKLMSEDDFQTHEEHLFRPPFVQPFIFTTNMSSNYTKKVNRYVVTNIPHLGYLEAYQHDERKGFFDVFFAFAHRGYRFRNVSFARDSLIQYFSQTFFPVPMTFEVNVVIQTEIGENHHLMNPSYLSRVERHICGEFGVYNEKTIPHEILTRYGVLSIDSFFNFRVQSDRNIDKIVRLFGQYVMPPEKLKENDNTIDILKWGKDEIRRLTKENWDNETVTTGFQHLIRLKLRKIQGLLTHVPYDERKQYYEELMKIRDSRKSRIRMVPRASLPVMPTKKIDPGITIEITDSDDEQEASTSQQAPVEASSSTTSNEVMGFKQISHSGKIQTGSAKDRSLLKSNVIPNTSLLKNFLSPSQENSLRKILGNASPTTVTNNDVI